MQSHEERTVEHGLAVTNRLFPTCSLVLEKHSSTNRSSFFCLVVYTFVLCGALFISPCVQAICIWFLRLCWFHGAHLWFCSHCSCLFGYVMAHWSLFCFFLNFFFFADLCWYRSFPLLLLSVSHNLCFCSYNITISSRVLFRAVFYCIVQSNRRLKSKCTSF